MTAPNHALAGALIGLSFTNPLLAGVAAFASHFVLDAVPHYDPPLKDVAKRIDSPRFLRELILSAILCIVLAICLAVAQPAQWFTGVICAFLAASPDLFWIPRFIHVKRWHTDLPPRGWLLRFHSWAQWRTGPEFWWFELLVFVGLSLVVGLKLWQTGA